MNQILTLLQPAVFLRWPLGTKGTKTRWKHLSQSDMTPDHLQSLDDGNVGVVFGRKSADLNGHVLADIDLDRADVVEAFMAANPRLRDGWLSRGRPDRLLVIVRLKGSIPRVASCSTVTSSPLVNGAWMAAGASSRPASIPTPANPTNSFRLGFPLYSLSRKYTGQ